MDLGGWACLRAAGTAVHLLDVQDVTGQAGHVWLREHAQVPISSLGLPGGPSGTCMAPKDRGRVRMKNFYLSKGIIQGT